GGVAEAVVVGGPAGGGGEVGGVQALQRLRGQPVELGPVEAGVARRQARQREGRRQRAQRGDLVDAVRRRADQERDVVDDRLGRVALVLEVGDRLGAAALRELLSVLVEQQAVVREARLLQLQGPGDEQLAGGV